MLLPLHLGQDEIIIVVIDDIVIDDTSEVSIFVEDQLPEFIGVDHSGFVEFIEEYYNWSGEDGNPINESFDLPNTADIDTTPDEFVEIFTDQFLNNFPATYGSGVDPRKLIKSIKDFYLAKGTEPSYKLLFRILFGENPVLYYPKKDMLKASDGKWREPTILKVTRTNDLDNIFSMVGRQIQQRNQTTNEVESYGFVEGILIYEKDGYKVVELEMSNVFGTLYAERKIECTLIDGTIIYEYVYPTLGVIAVLDGGSGYSTEDTITISGGMGVDADAKIEAVDKNGVIKTAKFTNSGINYRESDTITLTVNSNGGTGASLTTSGGVALDSRIGYYANNNGLLSSNKKLQDNFYYQDFSYVIKSSKSLDDYSDLMKKLIHPAGTKMFADALMREIRSAVAGTTSEEIKYETPLVGHYTPFNFHTIRNLRANGEDGSGGTDLYPTGYGWSGADGNTYVDETGASPHTYGASGPLGGATHEGGTDDIHEDGASHGVYDLDIMQGEQFDVVDGEVAGATIGDHWIVYPHPASRGITAMPFVRTTNLWNVTIPATLVFSPLLVGEYVHQETPYSQDAIGKITSMDIHSKHNILTIDVLSGLFQISNLPVIGGTTGLLHGVSSGSNYHISETTKNDKGTLGSNEFNYIQLEDFLFGIER
jgi:hypothetical protein